MKNDEPKIPRGVPGFIIDTRKLKGLVIRGLPTTEQCEQIMNAGRFVNTAIRERQLQRLIKNTKD